MSVVKIDHEAQDKMLKAYTDFCLLDELILQCAHEAWKLTGTNIYMSSKGQNNVCQSTIVKLMECYEKSYFHMKMKGESQEIREEDLKKCRKVCRLHARNIENESIKCDEKCYYYREMSDNYLQLVRKQFEKYLNDMDSEKPTLKYICYNQAQFDLLLPVVFFSLIILNEHNFETQKWRNKQLKKGKEVSWQINDPYILEVNHLQRYAENTSVKEVKKDKFSKSLHQKQTDETNVSISNIINSLSSAIKYVEKKDEIALFTGYANMSIFLYQILNAMHDPNKPMDTILRLFVMNTIDPDLLISARIISSGMDDINVITSKEVDLLHYFAGNDDNENMVAFRTSEEFPVSYMGELDLGVHKKKDRTIQDYLSLYKELTTNTKFNVSDPMALVRFYINLDAMELYVNGYQSILAFIEVAKELQESLSNLQYATQISKLIENLDHLSNRIDEEKEQQKEVQKEAKYVNKIRGEKIKNSNT